MTSPTITLTGELPISPARQSKERIHVLDALRGFALFGILFAHLSNEFAAGMLPQAFYQSVQRTPVDGIVSAISGIFVQGKFYTIFSFLFGLSFALQLGSAQEKGGNFLGRYAWRLLVLGIIGMIHHIHWRGDILTIYVMLGFVMLLFRNLPNKSLLIIALLLILNLPGRITEVYKLMNAAPTPDKTLAEQENKRREAQAQDYYDLIKNGSYVRTLQENFVAFIDKMDFQVNSGRIYITLGFFLLGLYSGRRKLFEYIAENKSLFRKITRYNGFATLGIIALACALFLTPVLQGNAYANLIGGSIFDFGNATLTFFYIAGVTLLFTRIRWARTVHYLAPVGKMALTSYLIQTAFGLLIFHGYAFNLFAEIGIAAATALTIPIFFLQIVFSKWWLSKYQYGPVEWLWRSLTYFKWQPITKPIQVPAVG